MVTPSRLIECDMTFFYCFGQTIKYIFFGSDLNPSPLHIITVRDIWWSGETERERERGFKMMFKTESIDRARIWRFN